MSQDTVTRVAMLRAMTLIRRFEECLLSLPKPGFQLLSSGEEAVAVGLGSVMRPGDLLLTSGRSIGPALALGLDPARVMAEVLGKKTGVCKGQGGRGHLSDPRGGLFGAHAVVGGNLSVAAGVALAMQMEGKPHVTVCLFGDGACGAGALHETLNVATLFSLPLVLVANNNQYSVSTPVSEALAFEPLASIALPFKIPARTVDGMDPELVSSAFSELSEVARSGRGPSFLECRSYRFCAHSTSSRESRPKEEIESWMARDPIRTMVDRLRSSGELSDEDLRRLEEEVSSVVANAAAFAEASPHPDAEEALRDVG